MNGSTAQKPHLNLVSPTAGEQTAEVVSLRTRAGASAALEGERIVLRDENEGLMAILETKDGVARLLVPAGDLEVSAPEGKLKLSSGQGIEMEAPSIEQRTRSLRVFAEEASVQAERWELRADRVRQWARNVYSETQDLFQSKAGRTRLVADELMQLFGRRTSIKSKDDTEINGRRVLLG